MAPDQLYAYTSGRWLLNEELLLAQRFVKFDVNNLCLLVASLFSEETRCVQIEKIEGNYNKALLLTMNDGNEAIAKIPCPNAGPSSHVNASEVATLKFCMTSSDLTHVVFFLLFIICLSAFQCNHIPASEFQPSLLGVPIPIIP
jgi:hypothetical protein